MSNSNRRTAFAKELVSEGVEAEEREENDGGGSDG